VIGSILGLRHGQTMGLRASLTVRGESVARPVRMRKEYRAKTDYMKSEKWEKKEMQKKTSGNRKNYSTASRERRNIDVDASNIREEKSDGPT